MFLVIFDQLISPEEVIPTIGLYAGADLKWEKDPAPFAPLRILERDSPELAYVASWLKLFTFIFSPKANR